MTVFRCVLVLLLLSLASGQSLDKRDQEFWNEKFTDRETRFDHRESRLLVEAIRGRQPGRAIDLGMGEGRNAVFLAMQGWQVTGVDISNVGVELAKKRAAALNLHLTPLVADLESFDLGRQQWDLIALFYMHAWYHGLKPANQQRLFAALKPGGLLVVEGFAGKEKYMFQPNELLRDFSNLRVLHYEDIDGEAEWAPGKQSRIVRFIAEKTYAAAAQMY